MQKAAIGTREYWDTRVLNARNDKDMIFLDDRREEYWKRVGDFLYDAAHMTALDVCCGYGQFARFLSEARYVGIDFSSEMIKLARQKHPEYNFYQEDAKTYTPTQQYDIIFEVNSLHSLGWTPEQFRDHYLPFARKAVMCLECDVFTLFQLYDKEGTN